MICYICGKEITDQPYFCIGRSKSGDKLYRHDDKEHEQAVLQMFYERRDQMMGEQIG